MDRKNSKSWNWKDNILKEDKERVKAKKEELRRKQGSPSRVEDVQKGIIWVMQKICVEEHQKRAQ